MDNEDMQQDMSLLLPATLRGRLYNMKLKLQDNWLPGQCCSSLPCDVNQTATCSKEETIKITEECKEEEHGCCRHLQEVANTIGCVVVMVTEEGTDVIIPAGPMNGQQIFVARWEGQYIPLQKEVSRHNHQPGKTLLENKTGWTKVKAPKMCNRTGIRRSRNHKTATQHVHCQSEKEVSIKDLQDNDSQNDNLVKICMDCCKNDETKVKRHHSEPDFCNIPKSKNRKRKGWKDMPDNRKKRKDHLDMENQRTTQNKLQKKVVEKKTNDQQERYQVFVCSDIAPLACLEVTSDMTVKCLKEDIFQTLGVSPEKQSLWTGRQFHLCEELSLEDHGIGPEANIHLDLTIGLLGGADREEGAGPKPHEQSQVQEQQVDATGGAHALAVGQSAPVTYMYDYQAVLYYENNHKSLADIREKIRPTLERWDVSVFDLTRDATTENIVQDIGHTVNKCMHAVFCLPISSCMEGFKFETFLTHKLDDEEQKRGCKILPIAFKPSDLADSNQTVRSVLRDEEVLKFYEADTSDFWRRLYRGLSKPGSPLSPSNVHNMVKTNQTLQAVDPTTLARALCIPKEVVKDVLIPDLFGSQNRQKEEFIRLWAGHCGPKGTRDALLKALQQHSNGKVPLY